LGKKEGSRKCKRGVRRIQRKNGYGNKKTREDKVEEQDFRRGELLGKFTVKMLYGWDNGKFEEKYLKKLERNWRRWKAVSPEEKP